MANRQRVSNQLRGELDKIPETEEYFALRYKYWKLIAAAQKSETSYRKATASVHKLKNKEKKAEVKSANPGLALLLKEKKDAPSS